MLVRRWIPLLTLTLAAAACERSATGPAQLRNAPAPAVRATYADIPVATRPQLLVDAQWLKANLDRPNVVVLYFGTSDVTYKAGHIPGARLITLGQVQGLDARGVTEPKPIAELRTLLEGLGVSTSDQVVVTGDTPREAARGFFLLDYAGHQQVSMLDGGLAAWKTVSTELSTDAPAVQRGKLATPAEPEHLVGTEWLAANYQDPGIVLLDARDAASFAGGHIPGAKSMPMGTLYLAAPNAPILKDVASLRALFTAAGVDQHSQIIAYCKTGMTSSLVYFAARYLGYDVKLYSESIDAWKAYSPALPIEK